MQQSRSLLLASLVAVSFALTGCSYDFAGPGTDSGETYGINETTTITQGNTSLEVTILDYRFVDTAQQTNDGATIIPPNGTRLLYVKVRVTNTGDEAAASPMVGAKPKASGNGTDAWPDWMIQQVYYPLRTVEAGETNAGWNQFVAPAGTAASDVEIAISTDLNLFSNEYDWRLD